MSRTIQLVVGAWIILCGGAAVQAGPSFTGLGDLPGAGFFSRAFGVSADGSVVVGFGRTNSGLTAFRWTSDSGIVGLGNLPEPFGQASRIAYGVSADGSVVVGYGDSLSGQEALRWTSAGAIVGLGHLPGRFFFSQAYDVSADGSVVAGLSDSGSGRQAFRWTSGGGMVGLGDLPGGIFSSFANGVSADGSVLVGFGNSASGQEAFRWTSGGGMDGLGDLPGDIFSSTANGVSADGSVVVGAGHSLSGFEAFRWTSGGGMVGLGDLPGGGFSSNAFDVSADGSVVVGVGTSASGVEASIWDEAAGMRSLRDVLVDDHGLDLTGWTLIQATGISAGGETVVGWGTNPSGNIEAWRVELDPLIQPNLSDLTGNGFVDFEDLTVLLANWNKDVGADAGNLVNADTTPVNFEDLTVLLADWTGPGPAGSPEAALGDNAVPEPSTLLLGVIATLGLSVCHRRKRRRVLTLHHPAVGYASA